MSLFGFSVMLSEVTRIITNHRRHSPRNINSSASSNPVGTFGIVHILRNSGSYFLAEEDFSHGSLASSLRLQPMPRTTNRRTKSTSAGQAKCESQSWGLIDSPFLRLIPSVRTLRVQRPACGSCHRPLVHHRQRLRERTGPHG